MNSLAESSGSSARPSLVTPDRGGTSLGGEAGRAETSRDDTARASRRGREPGGETTFRELGLRVFTTCEQSTRSDRDSYADQVAKLARWSEESGCEGILVYTDNSLVDPWLVSQLIIENTEILLPARRDPAGVHHPYSVVKMEISLAFLHGRRIWLNLVAGGFRLDLEALSDTTPHDERYERLVEYGQVVVGLLEGTPVTFDGSYYTVKALGLSPRLPEKLMPGITGSGFSPAGRRAARMVDATSVKYPQRVEEETQAGDGVRRRWDALRRDRPRDRRGSVGRRARPLPGRPQGAADPRVRDDASRTPTGIGSSPTSASSRHSRTRSIGWARSRTTRRSAHTSWGATIVSATS